MTLDGLIAMILRYFTEFNSFRGRLRHSGWRQTYNVAEYCLTLFAKTYPPCSTVSLR